MRDLRRHERMFLMAVSTTAAAPAGQILAGRKERIAVQESSLGNLGRVAGLDPSHASFLTART